MPAGDGVMTSVLQKEITSYNTLNILALRITTI